MLQKDYNISRVIFLNLDAFKMYGLQIPESSSQQRWLGDVGNWSPHILKAVKSWKNAVLNCHIWSCGSIYSSFNLPEYLLGVVLLLSWPLHNSSVDYVIYGLGHYGLGHETIHSSLFHFDYTWKHAVSCFSSWEKKEQRFANHKKLYPTIKIKNK